MVTLLAGCSMIPKMPKLPSFGINKQEANTSEASIASVAAVKSTREAMDKTSAIEKKTAEEKSKMEAEYAKFKEEVKKAYDDLKKKDQDNFDKIAELSYGIYIVTQEKKKIDINTTIAHLRSKEIIARTDKIPENKKDKIQEEIIDEKSKTIDQLYSKYKTQMDLAETQKAALDEADHLIQQKEKEKAELKEANRIALEKVESEKRAEIERVRREAADQVRLLQEAQKAQLLQYTVYGLGGLGLIFIVAGVLLKNFNLIGSGVIFLGLAYAAASIPTWIIAAVSILSILSMGAIQYFVKNKKKDEFKEVVKEPNKVE